MTTTCPLGKLGKKSVWSPEWDTFYLPTCCVSCIEVRESLSVFRYGRFESEVSYYICHSKETIARLFNDIRNGGKVGNGDFQHVSIPPLLLSHTQYHKTCGSYRVESIVDLTVGYDSTAPPPDFKPVREMAEFLCLFSHLPLPLSSPLLTSPPLPSLSFLLALLSVCLSVCLPVCLSLSLSLSVCLSVSHSISLSFPLFPSLSLPLPPSLCNAQSLPVDPNSQLIKFVLDGVCECTLRTSGTEPKIKYYIEMSTKPGDKYAICKSHTYMTIVK